VLKLCSRCDLACDHCYVYKQADQSWRRRPNVISDETVARAAERMAEHAQYHALSAVRVILHGGEPLLAGRHGCGESARSYAERWRQSVRSICGSIPTVCCSTTTSASLFAEQQVKVGISIDGDRAGNDRHRRHADDRSSYDQVLHAIGRLREAADRLSRPHMSRSAVTGHERTQLVYLCAVVDRVELVPDPH
jgi:uncharacterized protein